MVTSSDVSIHAPREGSDRNGSSPGSRGGCFNPRSPRRERPYPVVHHGAFAMFQSTLPAKGATNEGRPCRSHQLTFQSTLPAKGATLEAGEYQAIVRFQSTLPAKGATSPVATYLVLSRVSIHAPREGSDLTPWQTLLHRNSFNPRSPRRERPRTRSCPTPNLEFQSTLPAKGATRRSSARRRDFASFNPRSPRRERRWPRVDVSIDFEFQSTLPAKGATGYTSVQPST